MLFAMPLAVVEWLDTRESPRKTLPARLWDALTSLTSLGLPLSRGAVSRSLVSIPGCSKRPQWLSQRASYRTGIVS